jgi:hypothetical protein
MPSTSLRARPRPGAAVAATLLLGSGLLGVAAPASAAPPANDSFASPTVITDYGTWSTDNTEATYQVGEPTPSCAYSGTGPGPYSEGSVWYSFTPPESAEVTLSTEGSASPDTQIAVYTGSTLGGLTEVACGEDTLESLQTRLTTTLEAGTTYRVQVATWTDGEGASFRGPIDLTISAAGDPPTDAASDDFAGATPISGLGSWDSDNTSATVEDGEPLPSCAFNESGPGPWSEGTLWYAYTPATTETLYLDTYGSGSEDTQLVVYSGNSLANLMEIACSEDVPPGYLSALSLPATGGQTYYVQLATWTDGAGLGARGSIRLNIGNDEPVPPPANDSAEFAEPLFPGTTGGTSVGATTDETDGFVNGATGCAIEDTVWYSYVPDGSGTAQVALAEQGFDGALAYLEVDPDLMEVTNLACSEGGSLEFPVTAGFGYYVQVGSTLGQEGDFSLNLQGPGASGGDPAVSGEAHRAPGARVGFTVDVTTDGGGGAPAGVLTLRGPKGLRLDGVDAPGMDCDLGGRTVVCAVAGLPASSVESVTVTGVPEKEGPFTLRAVWEPQEGPMVARRSATSLVRAGALGRLSPRQLVDDPANNEASVVASRSTVCDRLGNAKDNTLKGGAGGDILCGLGGSDVLKGLGGSDILFGGSGADSLVGGKSRDTLYGGDGNDRCREASDTQSSC